MPCSIRLVLGIGIVRSKNCPCSSENQLMPWCTWNCGQHPSYWYFSLSLPFFFCRGVCRFVFIWLCPHCSFVCLLHSLRGLFVTFCPGLLFLFLPPSLFRPFPLSFVHFLFFPPLPLFAFISFLFWEWLRVQAWQPILPERTSLPDTYIVLLTFLFVKNVCVNVLNGFIKKSLFQIALSKILGGSCILCMRARHTTLGAAIPKCVSERA